MRAVGHGPDAEAGCLFQVGRLLSDSTLYNLTLSDTSRASIHAKHLHHFLKGDLDFFSFMKRAPVIAAIVHVCAVVKEHL